MRDKLATADQSVPGSGQKTSCPIFGETPALQYPGIRLTLPTPLFFVSIDSKGLRNMLSLLESTHPRGSEVLILKDLRWETAAKTQRNAVFARMCRFQRIYGLE